MFAMKNASMWRTTPFPVVDPGLLRKFLDILITLG